MKNKKQQEELKEEKCFVKLTNDKLFKVTFGRSDNRRFLEDLLESYYGYSKGYLKDKLEASYEVMIDKPTFKEKDSRNDIVVKFNNTYINIEMYKVFNDLAYEKSGFYIMRICTNKILIGDSYEKLEKVTQINFIEHDKINISEDLRSSKTLMPNVEMNFIKLDKVPRETSNEDRFYKYLRMFNAESFEEMRKIAEGDEVLMEIADWIKAYQGNDDPKFFNDDYWNEKIYRHEGRQEEKIEIAQNMLEANEPLDKIITYTGLSLEEITKLQKREDAK